MLIEKEDMIQSLNKYVLEDSSEGNNTPFKSYGGRSSLRKRN
jgi:hypothetical protein